MTIRLRIPRRPYQWSVIGFLMIALAIVAAAALRGQPSEPGPIRGVITPDGFRFDGEMGVIWFRPGAPNVVKRFNPAISWDGQSNEQRFGRYAEGDSSVTGMQTLPPTSAETFGGELVQILIDLYRHHGLTREPTTQEIADFALSNFGGRTYVGCRDYEGMMHRPHPVTPGCAHEQPTPRPPRPTPTPPAPSPTAEPVPTPAPCAACPPLACDTATIRAALEAVPERGIRRVTWRLRAAVESALAALGGCEASTGEVRP